MTVRDWLDKAKNEGFAIGAFNIDNLEIFKGVIAAAKNKNAPVITEYSPGEEEFIGLTNIVDLVQNAREKERATILINLDHCPDQQIVEQAIGAGFDMVHYDNSKGEYEDSVRIAKEIVPKAHAKGLTVEGEMDHIAGSSEVHKEQITIEEIKTGFTNPARAKEFVENTGIDIFASFFGNVHGVFPIQPHLDFELLKRIKEALPDTFLSMHGGSGIPEEEVRKAIEIGEIAKVNVNTELREAFRETTEKSLREKPDEYASYKLMPEVIAAVQSVVEHKIDIFGSAGKAG